MRVTVTLTAVLVPGVEAQTIAERLENYASDAIKYVDGVETVSTRTEVEVMSTSDAEGGK